LRDAVETAGEAVLQIDLRPDLSAEQLAARLAAPRPGQSMANHLRKALRLSPLETNLLREAHGLALPAQPEALAAAVKAAPLRVTAVQPMARAISTAGGVDLAAVDDGLMLRVRPGAYAAGEMLDWEAPTGGYLLQATFATGVAAARAALRRLESATR
jgi:predicted flavoprotein YhiN